MDISVVLALFGALSGLGTAAYRYLLTKMAELEKKNNDLEAKNAALEQKNDQLIAMLYKLAVGIKDLDNPKLNTHRTASQISHEIIVELNNIINWRQLKEGETKLV